MHSLTMSTTSDVRKGTSYEFRRYQPSDAEEFLELFGVVHRERRNRAWFRWRYERNPYVDHVPMFVAESNGCVVGVRPYIPFRMRLGGETALALLTADTMVHPDHRRRGLFTTLTEQSLSFYGDREPQFVFNQPNAASRPGFRELGWEELDEMTTYYRLQNPGALLTDRVDGMPRQVSTLAGSLADRVLGVRDHLAPSTDSPAVTRRRGVAADTLAALYRSDVPNGIHALRDEAFYRWRFASPEWTRATYVASVGGEPVAGALVRTRATDDVTVTQIADIVPLSGDEAWRSALTAIVDRVLDDVPDSDVVAAPARVFPAGVASAFGFLADDRLPLSRASNTDCRLCVRPLTDDGGGTGAGVALTDAGNWHLTFAERDTA